jgi:hypothetical protein
VFVYPFWDVERKGILHNGITIEADCDPRDFMAGKFKARLDSSAPNEILIELPSMRHSKLNESEKFKPRKVAFQINCPRTQEAEDVARNKILSDPERQKKHILLRFPEDMILTNKHYSPDSQEGGDNIEMEIVYIETTWTVPESNPVKTYPMLESVVQWKVSIVEDEPRIVKKTDKTGANPRAAKLAQRLQGMNVS